MNTLQIVGRRSSLFTRVPLIFAEELSVPCELVPIYDMTVLAPEIYAGNPALKLPILRDGDEVLFGTENICRALAERATVRRRVVWPEALTDSVSRNAQELVWHGMATQVQLVMGTVVNSLPADNPYFVKLRTGFEGALEWLDAQVNTVVSALPERDLSLFEVSLYCLVEHLVFRQTLPVNRYETLMHFCGEFGKRSSAQATAYRFDKKA